MTLKCVANFNGKLACGLKNSIGFGLIFMQAWNKKSENVHFDQILLSKEYKDLDEKVQKSYVSWHWKVMQSLKKKLTLGSKNDTRNLVDFMQSVASPKICTLMCYYCL